MHNNAQAFLLFFYIVFPINFKHLFQFRTECVNVGNRLLFSDEPTFFYTQKLFAVLLLLFLNSFSAQSFCHECVKIDVIVSVFAICVPGVHGDEKSGGNLSPPQI